MVLGGIGVAVTKLGRRCVASIAGASPAGGMLDWVVVGGCVTLIGSSEPAPLTGWFP